MSQTSVLQSRPNVQNPHSSFLQLLTFHSFIACIFEWTKYSFRRLVCLLTNTIATHTAENRTELRERGTK